ncbi:ECF RNA polymerase sigma factor SigK [Cryobacterium tepidiphilum]|uniref:Sigma-70 family RNA polymerase sigma factor n=1 Tax=Cryobacterium tepidiphilum TaxID=2486026 RepID=A0A3M8LDV2_9MICO|nr:ECF RNA polymerase sigma factor SigK [Cryobacterium tepidiphilum]RNE63620.1 sigma-70 family RNA polymerase sigma factor [Cryobacterium tepidiphilum]
MTPRAAHSSENQTLETESGTTESSVDGIDGGADAARASLESQLEASSHGDEQAFAHLYDNVAPRIHGMVLRVLRDVHQSEEVTQEVFLEIWRTSSRFDQNRGSALAWVMTMAHRKAVDRVRSSEAWRRRDAADAERSRRTLTDETASAAQASLNAQGLRAALRSLSACQRQAIELAYFGGYTHSEVSELLQVPLGTAKTRIRDGLIRLRDTLSA